MPIPRFWPNERSDGPDVSVAGAAEGVGTEGAALPLNTIKKGTQTKTIKAINRRCFIQVSLILFFDEF